MGVRDQSGLISLKYMSMQYMALADTQVKGKDGIACKLPVVE